MTKQETSSLVLSRPFDVEVHSKTFINYCEVIIWPDGKIEYAVPSHDQKLIEIYMHLHDLTREEAIETLRKISVGIDVIMQETGIIQVWYDYMLNVTPLTKKQLEALHMLVSHNCVSPIVFQTMKVL